MQEMDDIELLREFVRNDSQAAFAALVERRAGLVYSAALRQLCDPHLAEDVTQAVFIILAQKAARISDNAHLTGWLFQTTRFAALAEIRASARRQQKAKEFQMQTEHQQSEPDPAWEQMSPLLDEALANLGKKDRQAVLLRFFENKSLTEVGTYLGTNENTAGRRVTRALEKLRHSFLKRGVAVTTVVIGGAMTANSIQAAPTALVTSISAVVVTHGAAASGSTLTLVKGALKLMAWTKLKTAIVVGAALLLAAGTTTITIRQIEKHKTYSWQGPKADFNLLYKTPPQVVIVPTKFTQDGQGVSDGSRGAMGIAQSVQGIVHAAYQTDRLRTVFPTDLPQGKYDFFAKLSATMDPNPHWAEALQAELKTKLGVVGKTERREADVLFLKNKNSDANGFKPAGSLRRSMNLPKGMAIMPGNGKFLAFDQPLSTLTSYLERRFEIPIVDQTELTNHSDFALKWDESDPKQAPNLDGLKNALLDQLGLELVPGRESIEMLVVKRVKK